MNNFYHIILYLAQEDACALIVQLARSIDDAALHVHEQQDWLKLYFSKGKLGRKTMFRKYTWFGIPLN